MRSKMGGKCCFIWTFYEDNLFWYIQMLSKMGDECRKFCTNMVTMLINIDDNCCVCLFVN